MASGLGALFGNQVAKRPPNGFAKMLAGMDAPASFAPADAAVATGESYDPSVDDSPRPTRVVPVKPLGELKPLDAAYYYADMPVMDRIDNIGRTLGRALGFSPTAANRMGQDTQNLVSFVPGVGDAVGALQAREDFQKGDYGKAALDAGLAAIGLVPGVGDVAAKAGREGAETVAETLARAVKPAAETWRHPVSSVKLRRPLEEMTATYAPGPPLLPKKEYDFESVPMDSYFVPLWGDRTRAGEQLTGVNEMLFDKPVNLQGGSDFTRGPQQQAEQAFWASDPGVITTKQNQIRALQETGDPVYAAHAAMGSEAGDYSSQTTNTLLQMVKQKPPPQEAKTAFDLAMRSDWGKDFPAVADFPGIDNVTPEWLQSAGKARTKIAKLMDTAKFQGLGFPDVGSARKAVTVPELLDVPTGSSGHNIVQVGPEAVRAITDPTVPHADYARQLAGGGYAGSTEPLPMDVFWSDWMKTRKPGENPSHTQRAFGMQPVVQRKTQEWLDRLMKYKASEQGKKLGLAGAIGAGLITASEAKELFGFDSGET